MSEVLIPGEGGSGGDATQDTSDHELIGAAGKCGAEQSRDPERCSSTRNEGTRCYVHLRSDNLEA